MKVDISKDALYLYSLDNNGNDNQITEDGKKNRFTSNNTIKTPYLNKIVLRPRIGRYLILLDYGSHDPSNLLETLTTIEDVSKQIVQQIET